MMLSLSYLKKIPTPILSPNELILNILIIKKVYIDAQTTSENAITYLKQLKKFYQLTDGKHPNYDYCIIYITNIKLLIVPVLKSEISICRSFTINYNSRFTKCQLEKDMIYHYDAEPRVRCYRFNYHLSLDKEDSILLTLMDEDKAKINSIATTISLLSYYHEVAKFLSKPPVIYSLKVKTQFHIGKRNFFSTNGSFHNRIDEYEEQLPTYEQTERAVGKFFKSKGLLDQVRTKTNDKLVVLTERAQRLDNYLTLIMIKETGFEKTFGNFRFKLLLNHCLRYTQRQLQNGSYNVELDSEEEVNEREEEEILETNEIHRITTAEEQLLQKIRDIEDTLTSCLGITAPKNTPRVNVSDEIKSTARKIFK